MYHAYCFGVNPAWKKMWFQLTLNNTFCPTSQPLTHRQLRHCQITKIKKIRHSSSISSLFHTNFTTSELKSTEVFHSNGNWTRTVSIGFLNKYLKIYHPTDSELKFHKMEIENWLRIGFNLESSWLGPPVITTTLYSTANGERLKVLCTLHKVLE